MAIGVQSLAGIYFEDYQLTYLISGSPDPVASLGCAVTIDTTAANTMRLAAAGERIFGRLETCEVRTVEGITVGTVARKFSDTLPIKVGEVFNVGDTAVGSSTLGSVEVLKVSSVSAPDYNQNVVTEVRTDGTVVVQNF